MRRHRIGSTVLLASFVLASAAVEVHATEVGTSAMQKILDEAHSRFAKVKDGKNADYIPALAKVRSSLFGIALVTPDGRVYSSGDADARFSIQSISKVFTMALVMQAGGAEGEQSFLDGIGVDATGQAFNSIVAIEQWKGRQMNPMVNAGAIATTGRIDGKSGDEKWKKIQAGLSDFAGRSLELNKEVYESEAATNQRNQAIATLMAAYGLIEDDPKMVTDVYTRQCSLDVSARDLAIMAGTLANGGTNPVTRKNVLEVDHVPQVLAVMATAGLYDDSGIWLYKVGLPGKSGVGGGIIAVAPGRFGIAAFSPPVDAAGNSVRAQRAIEYIVERLGANLFASTPYDSGAK